MKFLSITGRITIGAICTSLLLTQPLNAATENAPPVVVTATRTAQTADEALASVTVITRERIIQTQAQSVPEILRKQSGISITNNGGTGKLSSIFLRGTQSDHVLFMIDGIKVGSATSGTTAIQNMDVSQIERIEIVRGPRSSLYGADAIGGVIQIFTRRGSSGPAANFSVSTGKYDTHKVTVGASAGNEKNWFNANFSNFSTNGFNSCRGKPFPDGAGCFTIEPDDDSYRSKSALISAGHHFNNDLSLDVSLSRTDGFVEFDGFSQNESDVIQQQIASTLEYSPTEFWHSTLVAGYSEDNSDNYKNNVFSSRFNSMRDSVSWQNDISLRDTDLLTLGADYLHDRIDSSITFDKTTRENIGYFAQYQTRVASHDLILAARQDTNSQFGTHTTGSLSWGYPLSASYRLVASVANAFKAPSFNELYFPGFGNPNLDPESARTIEAGLKGKETWGSWDISVYQTEFDDLIAFDGSISAPANIESARLYGLETQVYTRINKWDVVANLSLLDTENKTPGSDQGNEFPRRPKQTFNLDLDRKYGRYSLGVSLQAKGRTYDNVANTRELDAYTLVDLRAAYKLSKDWLLQARVNNLFEKEYETAAFYNQPESDFLITLRYQPETR